MRIKLHAFIIAWLCFVALPSVVSCALHERTDGIPSVEALAHLDKLVRPQPIAVAAADDNRDIRSSSAPQPDVATAKAGELEPGSTAPRNDQVGKSAIMPPAKIRPYAPRAPPHA